MSRLEKNLLFLNVLLYGFVTIFSYAYVDLNLTISQNKIFLYFVDIMQKLGYYYRPQATFIYVTLITIAFGFFIYNLYLAAKDRISAKYVMTSASINVLILVFAYPFLSSDLFNYLFDAKIITHYHLSPYTHKPLDFPGDEWIRFMRWTHRYSPYGPLWLGISIIPSFLGFGKFILSFFTFKITIAAFHLINTYLIFKTLTYLKSKQILLGTAFYALNPLFLIEGVVNAHNDVVFAAFLLAAIYFWTISKKGLSYLSLILGTFVKYISILNLPSLLIASFFKSRISFSRLVTLNLITMAVFTYIFSSFRINVPFVSAGSTQVQFQPWYLFWTLPFISLIPATGLIVVSIVLSIGVSLRYLPFLYYGDWFQPGTIEFMRLIAVLPMLLTAIIILLKNGSQKLRKRN